MQIKLNDDAMDNVNKFRSIMSDEEKLVAIPLDDLYKITMKIAISVVGCIDMEERYSRIKNIKVEA